MAKERPLKTCPSRGPMRHWHTVGLDIPRPVARLQSLTPLLQATVHSTLAKDATQSTGNRRGRRGRGSRGFSQDRERDSGCIPGSDLAQCDAAGVKGSNRIISHGAPLSRLMPKGCLGSPVLVLLFGLDRGFLMDVGPRHPVRDWAAELTAYAA